MKNNVTFAIVDIEATGGAMNADEKIIQIACVLYRNGQIIEEFNSLVNPERKIPYRITELTGVTNKQVRTAPYFDEIAPLLKNLLADSVFVAHNVGFDYQFLNEKLEEVGLEPLELLAIDTVDLSQILFPMSASYRLEDLALHVGYDVFDAHDAHEDALATVFLLQKLWDKALAFPAVTLKKLADLAECLSYDTAFFFKWAYEEKQISNYASMEHVILHNLALKYHEPTARESAPLGPYPKNVVDKKELFKDELEFRPNQAQMMDELAQYLSEKRELDRQLPVAVEAPAGIGKTMGYILPALYYRKNNEPVLISTYTTLLQEQIKNDTLTAMNRFMPQHIQATVVKSQSHYLSLTSFRSWLQIVRAEDSTAKICMRILVWLLETDTGSLDEIDLGDQQDSKFWQIVRASNDFSENIWGEYDFLSRREQAIASADVLITNHSFLCADWSKEEGVLPKQGILIIDEAHHFPDQLLKSTVHSFSLNTIEKYLKVLSEVIPHPQELGSDSLIGESQCSYLYQQIDILKEQLFDFIGQFFDEESSGQTTAANSWINQKINPFSFTFHQKKSCQEILNGMSEILWTLHQWHRMTQKKLERGLPPEDTSTWMFFQKLANAQKHGKKLYQLLTMFFEEGQDESSAPWVSFYPNRFYETVTFYCNYPDKNHQLLQELKKDSLDLIFTSGTLTVRDNLEYMERALGDLKFELIRIKSDFNFEKQAKILLPEKALRPLDSDLETYRLQIVRKLERILPTGPAKILILFSSQSLLEEVAELMKEREKLTHYRILAQGVSGSRSRILKRFKSSKNVLLLATSSFSEGIDLPHEMLDVVCVVRLPFEHPTEQSATLIEKTEHRPDNMFMDWFLPRAVIKFKQAFGRLIRSPEDRGLFIVLDSRYQTAPYRYLFQQELPEDVSCEIQKDKAMRKTIQTFISEKHE